MSMPIATPLAASYSSKMGALVARKNAAPRNAHAVELLVDLFAVRQSGDRDAADLFGSHIVFKKIVGIQPRNGIDAVAEGADASEFELPLGHGIDANATQLGVVGSHG